MSEDTSDMDIYRDKIAYFQAATGLDDTDLCFQILAVNNWDLEQAVSTFTSRPQFASTSGDQNLPPSSSVPPKSAAVQAAGPNPPPGIAWRLITLPFYVVSGGLGLFVGSIRLGTWIAGTVFSRSLSLLGLTGPPSANDSDGLVTQLSSAAEAAQFVNEFTRDYGSSGTVPRFVAESFMDALQRSQREFKLLFVYLHSPEHPEVPLFCETCLCSPIVAAFINENFVAWGGSIRRKEGFKMSNSLYPSLFPFCAVVTASNQQRIVLLEQLEGPKPPKEMLTILQRVVEECALMLVCARIEGEERRTNQRWRKEQDAAYRAALEADQARELQRREEEHEGREREAAEAGRKRKEEEEALERAASEAAEKEAALKRRRQEKAMSLGSEPEKGPEVSQVLVRFPTGERKGRRFHSSATISKLYDYVDSLDCLNTEKYSLVSNFPRIVLGPEKHSLTLKEAGVHPHAGLFVELNE